MLEKKIKNLSVGEKLSSLIQSKPSGFDSDSDNDLITVDKLASKSNDSDFSADELDVAKFRKLNDTLLDENDLKYKGKGVSRKNLYDFDNGSSDDEENEPSVKDDEFGNNDEEGSDSDVESEDEDEDAEEDENENEKEEEFSLSSDQDVDSKQAENVFHHKNYQSDQINHKQIFLNAEKDIEKGAAIKNQLHLWDFFLDCRMKLQPSLVNSNQLPTYKNIEKFKKNPEFDELRTKTCKSYKHLLRSLLSLQEVLLNNNEEFNNSYCDKEVKAKNDDESTSEIESNLESDEDTVNTSQNKNFEKKNSFKNNCKKLKDFSSEINKRHKHFETYRNNTIQKWDDKTRLGNLSSKNFSAFEQSTLKQIEHVLLNKERLIARTQTKRSSYHILGQLDDDEPRLKKMAVEENNSDYTLIGNERNKTKINKEIFDDDDFYHQLLSELVKRKANNLTDPVQLGRQWMQLQQIRGKMKKVVDTKASKGRKVRFVVHPKLVNFMMPVYNSVLSEESRAELITSLFGKKN